MSSTRIRSKWISGLLEFFGVTSGATVLKITESGIEANVTGQSFGTVTEYTTATPAIALTDKAALLDATSNGVAATLAAGTAGQKMTIKAVVVSGGAVTLVPAVFEDGTTITFGTILDSIVLISDGTGWYIESNTGCEVA